MTAEPALPLDDTEPATAGPGHNNPPPEPVYDEAKLADFRARVEKFNEAAKAWAKVERIESEAQAGRAADFISGGKALYDEIEKYRMAARAVWTVKADEVQKAFSPLSSAVKGTAGKVKPLTDEWQREQREAAAAEKKRLAEEAARLEAEAAAALEEAQAGDVLAEQEAEAKAKEAAKLVKQAARPVKVGIKSASGSGRSISQRLVRNIRITSLALAFAAVKSDPDVIAAVVSALKRKVRSKDWNGAAIPGVEVTEDYA